MTHRLARIDLAGAPVGTIFDSRDPDTHVEDLFFDGWRLPLTPHGYWRRPSPFLIDMEEEGGERPVLECGRAVDAALIAGDADWGDYTVRASVRLISASSPPDDDHPHDARAHAGVLACYQTSRHYYYWAIVSDGRAVLYRRHNSDWTVLSETPVDLDRRAYYDLSLEVRGSRLRAAIGGAAIGDTVLEVNDSAYTGGPGGIRTNARARWDGVEITAAAGEPEARAGRRAAREQRYRDLQAQYPREVLLARHPLPDWAHERSALGRVGPGGAYGLLLSNSVSVFSALFARTYSSGAPAILGVADLEGNLVWGREMAIRFPRLHDADGDGRDEILGILDGRMVVLSPDDGAVLHEAPLPESCPFQGLRGQPIDPDLYPWIPADLRGTGRRSDIIVKDDRDSRGGRTLWAYDGALRPLWTARVGHPRYGHTVSVCDIDGDGRDEILAGFTCLRADGSRLWTCREAELNEDDHVDEVHLGLFGPDGEPRACGTNGADGAYILDGLTGQVIARHSCGHVQGMSVGRYLHGGQGHAYCVGSRWGSFGILNVLDAQGRVVATWEPDNVSQGGPPVRWTGDGREFIFLSSTPQSFGLWDGNGRRCVALDCTELPAKGLYGIAKGQGTVLDIDDDGRDELIFTFPEGLYVYGAER